MVGYIAQHLHGGVLSDSAKARCIMQAWDVKDLKASRHGQVLASLASQQMWNIAWH